MERTTSRTGQLIYVPERHKVVETFGWQPGIWGALFIAAACVFVPNGDDSSNAVVWMIFAPSAALGLSLTGYEIWRRRNRTVLVKEGGSISVFRKGRLDLTLAPNEMTRVQADLITLLKIGVPLGVCGALFTAVGIVGLLRDKTGDTENLLILFLGLVCWASLVSAAWTRFSCCHLRVPVKGSRWSEESVLIPSSRLKELFP